MKRLLAAALLVWAAQSAFADASPFVHTPVALNASGTFQDGQWPKRFTVGVPSKGYVRGRVLLQSPTGLQSFEMSHDGTVFRAVIEAPEQSTIRYHIQLLSSEGGAILSKLFSIDVRASEDSAETAEGLLADLEILEANATQMESIIHAIRTANPAEVGRYRSHEFERAATAVRAKELRLRNSKIELRAALEAARKKLIEEGKSDEEILMFSRKYEALL